MPQVKFKTLIPQGVKQELQEVADRINLVYRFVDEIYNDQTCEILPVLKDAEAAVNTVWTDIDLDGIGTNDANSTD
jgi:hypothetical protein